MTMPVAFVSHGAPTLALDGRRGAQLRAWGESLPRPAAIVVVSAHWLEQHAMTGTERTRPLMYDFSGFPRELYRIEYGAPGSGLSAKASVQPASCSTRSGSSCA